jgi:hypothetical protein
MNLGEKSNIISLPIGGAVAAVLALLLVFINGFGRGLGLAVATLLGFIIQSLVISAGIALLTKSKDKLLAKTVLVFVVLAVGSIINLLYSNYIAPAMMG